MKEQRKYAAAKTGPNTPEECRALVDNWINAIEGSNARWIRGSTPMLSNNDPLSPLGGVHRMICEMEARAVGLEKLKEFFVCIPS